MLFWPFLLRLHFKPYFYLMFDDLNGFVESECNDTEYNDTCNHHIQLKDLGSIDNQIPKSPSRCQKFADDDPYKCQADIYFGGA